jgi:glycosyltransferase involved in cell wall biosynthesis
MDVKVTPLVSICCATYNHERYIRDVIDGFLMQKTTFPIEIIIHDDASTDGTARIVKEYAEKHPDLIVPIFQKSEIFSLGLFIPVHVANILPCAKEKAIEYVHYK